MAVELARWIAPATLIESLLVFSSLEALRPLRGRGESRGLGFARNASVALLGHSTIGVLQVFTLAAFADVDLDLDDGLALPCLSCS